MFYDDDDDFAQIVLKQTDSLHYGVSQSKSWDVPPSPRLLTPLVGTVSGYSVSPRGRSTRTIEPVASSPLSIVST